jgi:hypothetical protein
MVDLAILLVSPGRFFLLLAALATGPSPFDLQ